MRVEGLVGEDARSSVARIAASDRALPASVPPMPPTSMPRRRRPSAASRSATSARHAVGRRRARRPRSACRSSTKSGSRPVRRACSRRARRRCVWVSSITSSVPCSARERRAARRGSRAPAGRSRCSSAPARRARRRRRRARAPRSSASTSLNSTTCVVSAGSTGGPTLPGRERDRAVASSDRERLVDGAVVAPVEDEDLRPAGDRAGRAGSRSGWRRSRSA